MDKIKGLEEIKNRKGKFEYKGKLEEFQQRGSENNGKRYMEYEIDPFNQYQNFLYKRALFGLKIYTPEELDIMKKEKRARINKIQRKSQRILNVYKQEIVNKLTNNIFQRYFPNSPITKALMGEFNFTDAEHVNTLDFKELGISKEHIVNRLIQEKVLPKNFYDLKSVTLHD
jgi:hypothetical protein